MSQLAKYQVFLCQISANLPLTLILGHEKYRVKIYLTSPEKGKTITTVPKGSTKAIEQAKQLWHVEYYIENPATSKLKRQRESNGLNRIKDSVQKQIYFDEYIKELTELLKAGYSPFSDNSDFKNYLLSGYA